MMQSKFNNMRAIAVFFCFVFSLTACAGDYKSPQPGDGGDGGPDHKVRDPERLAPYRITLNNNGDVVLLDEKGEEIKPNADLPLRVKARFIETIETITVVRYRGSPEFDIVKIGGREWQIPVRHAH